MSSVTRFLRQIPTGQTLYNASLVDVAAAAYTFVPTSGNYVGNYPPGYVAVASAGVKNAILTAANPAGGVLPVVRDMGKTIFAPISADAGVTSTTGAYFRQIQVLVPQDISSTQGFIGGVGGNTFGVAGTAPTYLTVYVRTTIGGAGVPSGINTPLGQM